MITHDCISFEIRGGALSRLEIPIIAHTSMLHARVDGELKADAPAAYPPYIKFRLRR